MSDATTSPSELASTTELTREQWLERSRFRNPEMEQIRFGGDPAPAAGLAVEDINPFNAHLFREDRWQEHFARLRREDPVHLNELASAGRYWSITTWDDVRTVEGDWDTFSSGPGVTLSTPVGTALPEGALPFDAFISMDPPRQTEQRKTVRGISAPSSLRNLDDLIRERTVAVLESLPEGETFDWVETVSVELTTLMLATLFGFPLEDRHLLTRWSDVVTTVPEPGTDRGTATRLRDEILDCVAYFDGLWAQRRAEPGFDLVSMLAHGESTREMSAMDHLGNLLLLIVGGNDTTRNSMSGSVYALNRWPEEYERLDADHSLVSSLVPEVIRWQTPLSYMRRTATRDTELGGKRILEGDQVLMWYCSANRDEAMFGDDADALRIGRTNAERHLSFGHGVHYCMGARIAELQLRILWEEILPRFSRIEVQGEPERTLSSCVHGYTSLPVRVSRR